MIANKNGILLKKNYGIGSPEDNKNFAYSVGSITKQFTATGILVLEQTGLLNTNDKISKHLFGIPEDKSNITIHHLLTHTSGLKDDYWDQHKDLTEAEYIKLMLSEKVVAAPGAKYDYINFGFHLLAKIIEKCSNKSYEQFLVEDIFRPNGLNYTGFNLVKWQKNQVAEYNDWPLETYEIDIRNPLNRPVYFQPEGSGGIFSTIEDLYKSGMLIIHLVFFILMEFYPEVV